MQNSPESIFKEYAEAETFKASLGNRGLVEQSKMNERFFTGDQWHGAKCGNERPLVRHNLIKRIGDYKMSVLLSSQVSISYSAEGIPNTVGLKDDLAKIKKRASISPQKEFDSLSGTKEIAFVMSAFNDYQRVTADRVKFSDIAEQALRDAYISGTGIIYTYWDPDIKTGLYADDERSSPIKGDIMCESVSVENVYFGDPYCENTEDQPYIIIKTVLSSDEVLRQAVRNGVAGSDIENISNLCKNNDKLTVLTKFWKRWNERGTEFTVMAKKVLENAVLKDEWDMQLRMYPICVFKWERRRNMAYGESEITYLIPNQIAVNRMITSGVWSAMSTGMPTMIVNGDVVDGEITNEPGQIIKVYGNSEEVKEALKFVAPPDCTSNYMGIIEPLIENTLTQSGANSAALGDVDPDNTSAILALRNVALVPLQRLQNRFFSFLEDVSRVFAEFWITKYGNRRIKINDESGTWYMPFYADRYKELIICAKADAQSQSSADSDTRIKTLDNLLEHEIITPKQYLERLPKGTVSDIAGLIKDMGD